MCDSHNCNHSTREAETGGLGFHGKPGLHHEFQARLADRRPYHKVQNETNNTSLQTDQAQGINETSW